MASIIKKLINGILGDVVQLDHSAQDIDDTITKTSQLTGRNLLDNWYFADPINQRGQTSYTGAVYGVDRWRSFAGNTVTVESTGVRITGSNDTAYSNMIQQNFPEELLNALDGKTVTASILASENTGGGAVSARLGATFSTTITTGLSTLTVTFDKSRHGYFSINCSSSKTANFVVQAVKLELGTQQTLARKAVDGTWVLIDPPPNKAEELAKCQRYFQTFSSSWFIGRASSANSTQFVVPISVAFRTTPVLSDTGPDNWRVQYYAGDYIGITGVKIYTGGVNNSFVTLYAESSGAFSPGNLYSLTRVSSNNVYTLSADL